MLNDYKRLFKDTRLIAALNHVAAVNRARQK